MEPGQLSQYAESPTRYKLTFTRPIRLGGRLSNSITGEFTKSGEELLFGDKRLFSAHALLPYIDKVEPMAPKASYEERKAQAGRRMLKLLHPNAWGNIRAELEAGDYRALDNSNLTFYNVGKAFPRLAVAGLRDVFEQRLEYRWRQNSNSNNFGRDFTIQTKEGEGGIFKAWFSSEYPGCGNGSYYLLLSPEWAIHCEDD